MTIDTRLMRLFGKKESECSIEQLATAFHDHGIMTTTYNLYVNDKREEQRKKYGIPNLCQNYWN